MTKSAAAFVEVYRRIREREAARAIRRAERELRYVQLLPAAA